MRNGDTAAVARLRSWRCDTALAGASPAPQLAAWGALGTTEATFTPTWNGVLIIPYDHGFNSLE